MSAIDEVAILSYQDNPHELQQEINKHLNLGYVLHGDINVSMRGESIGSHNKDIVVYTQVMTRTADKPAQDIIRPKANPTPKIPRSF